MGRVAKWALEGCNKSAKLAVLLLYILIFLGMFNAVEREREIPYLSILSPSLTQANLRKKFKLSYVNRL